MLGSRPRFVALRRVLVALAVIGFAFPPTVANAAVSGSISAAFIASDQRTVGINTNANLPVNAQPTATFTTGSGSGQVQVLWQASRTFSGTTDTLNTYSGSLVDSYGTVVALTSVKAIYIQNTSATNSIVIGNAGSTPMNTLLNATGTLTLNAGDWIVVAAPTSAGWGLTGSNFNILVTGTNGQTYTIVMLGIGT